jgi:hypothetical protein
MAYADFDLETVVQRFELARNEDTDLFEDVELLEPSDVLREWLDEFAPLALAINTEQARREYIIAPIMGEAMRRSRTRINVFPGVTFNVDQARGLTGVCDYLIARSAERYFVEAPVVAIVEAKKEDITSGLGQCVAEMVAIQLFNERKGKPLPVAHGCVTSGNLWKFLRLKGGALHIDAPEYYLRDVAKILGILVCIARGDRERQPTE